MSQSWRLQQKFRQFKKKEQEALKAKEEEGTFKFEEFNKINEQEELKSKEDLISKLESFEVDNNKKNQLKKKI